METNPDVKTFYQIIRIPPEIIIALLGRGVCQDLRYEYVVSASLMTPQKLEFSCIFHIESNQIMYVNNVKSIITL